MEVRKISPNASFTERGSVRMSVMKIGNYSDVK